MITPPPLPAPLPLSLSELTLPKERTYFTVVVVIAVLVWLGLAVTVVGLFYALFFGLLLWLGNGLLIAHLRAECVRVDESQMPQLYANFLGVCQRLKIREVPGLYVLQSGGVLNAFATRFSGRNFVVVYSDLLESFGADSPEMSFILGHELGHLKSNHVLKQVLLAPGIFAPLAGTAYLRACEASCDRHGLFAAGDIDGSARALLALGGGKFNGRTLDAAVFADQHRLDRGFFISWHELTSAYPTMSQRVANVLAIREPKYAAPVGRNPFAYVFALFSPGGRASAGSANLLVFVVIIGLLAAMAIPAFQKVRQASIAKACVNNQRMLEAAIDQYQLTNNRLPKTFADVAGPGNLIPSVPVCPGGGSYSAPRNAKGEIEVTCSVHGHGPQPLSYPPPRR